MTRAVVLTLIVHLLMPHRAQAAPVRPLGAATMHVLARTLIGEADGNRADWAPMAYVLGRRWDRRAGKWDHVVFARWIRMYSAIWKSHEHRPVTIRLLPWSAWGGPWGGTRWDAARAFVRAWTRGEVRDPCPSAMHWGGTMDKPQLGWEPVDCGQTKNIFYRVRGSHDLHRS